MVNVAILGFGVVGSGVADVLTMNADSIAKRVGQAVNLTYILDVRDFPDSPYQSCFVKDFAVIEADPEVDVVVETIGGARIALEFTQRALKAGKSVVSSNKELVATHGYDLLQLAKANGVSYLFEASVGGGIPIIRPLQTDLVGNEILAISGILNGTTNYILTKMKNEGAAFDGALKEAQSLGYAEANPAADVEGLDAARKTAILTALSYGVLIDPKTIPTDGITGITPEHTAVADKLGCAVKLIGHTERINGRVYAAVSPYLVPAANPLCNVDGVYNGILVDSNMLGRALFYGAGAGKLPTASAVVADIIDILSHRANGRMLPKWRPATEDDIADASDYSCRRCFLIEGCPMCAAKAKTALNTEDCVFVEDGKFAVVSAPMTEKDASAALAATGLQPVFCLPVLD